MIVRIYAKGFPLSPALSEHAEAQIRLALGLYENKIRKAEASLILIEDPKNNEDKLCRIKLRAEGIPNISVHETSQDMYDAINNCSRRLRRTVIRRFGYAQPRRKNIGNTLPGLY